MEENQQMTGEYAFRGSYTAGDYIVFKDCFGKDISGIITENLTNGMYRVRTDGPSYWVLSEDNIIEAMSPQEKKFVIKKQYVISEPPPSETEVRLSLEDDDLCIENSRSAMTLFLKVQYINELIECLRELKREYEENGNKDAGC
jgi:hypothetical protein